MSIRRKKRRRLIILGVAFVSLVLLATAAYFAQQYRLDRRARAHRVEGMAALEEGEHLKALDRLGRYLQRFPDDAEAWYRFALARRQVEMPNGKHIFRAIGYLQKARMLDPSHAALRRELLDLYDIAMYNVEALELAAELIKEKQDDPLAWRVKASALERQRAFTEALEATRDYLALEPDSLEGHLQFIRLLMLTEGPTEGIVEHVLELRKQHEGDHRFDLLLGIAHAGAGDVAKAKEILAALAEKPPLDDSEYIRMLVSRLDQLDLHDSSMSVLRRVPDKQMDPELLRLTVRRLWQEGKAEDLLRKVEAAAEAEDPELLGLQALALASVDRDDEAQACVGALSARQGEPRAEAWAVYLRDVALADDPAATTRLDACRRAVELDPANAVFQDALGEAWARLGEREQACAAWSRAAVRARSWSDPVVRAMSTLLSMGLLPQATRFAEVATLRGARDTGAGLLLALEEGVGPRSGGRFRIEPVLRRLETLEPRGEVAPLMVGLLARAGAKERALEAARSALGSGEPLTETAYLLLARASDVGELGIAEECLARSEQAHGRTPGLVGALAGRLARAGKPEEGQALLEHAVREATEDRLQWELRLARFLDETSDPDAALAAWTALVDAHPEDPSVLRGILGSRAAWRDPQMVDRAISALHELTGDEGVGWRVARARRLLEDPDGGDKAAAEAATILHPVVDVAPYRPGLRRIMAQALTASGDIDGAIEQLETASNLRGGWNPAELDLARLQLGRGDVARARSHVDRVVRSGRAAPHELRSCAAAYLDLGDPDEAVAILNGPRAREDGEEGARKLLLARALAARGDGPEAEELCVQLVGDAASPEAVALLAEIRASRGDDEGAAEALARLDALDLADWVKQGIRAEHRVKFGDVGSAFDLCRSALDGNPGNPVLWLRALRVAVLAGMRDEFHGMLNDACKACPESSHLASLRSERDLVTYAMERSRLWPILLAWISDETNREPSLEALRIFGQERETRQDHIVLARSLEELAGSYPRFLALQLLAAEALGTVGSLDRALSLALRAARSTPTNYAPLRVATVMLAGAGRWAEAIPHARAWLERSRERPNEALLHLAELHIRSGNPQGALREMDPFKGEFLRPERRDWALTDAYGRALLATGATSEADRVLGHDLDRDDKARIRWVGVATIIESVPDAEGWIRRVAPAMRSGSLDERMALSSSWLRLWERSREERHREACRAALESIAKSSATPAQVRAAVASFFGRLGDTDKAAESYRAALAEDNTLAAAKNNLAVILAGREDLEGALVLAREALEAAPRNLEYRDTLAAIHRQAGNLESAIDLYRANCDQDPESLRWRVSLGEVLVDAKRLPEARDVLREGPIGDGGVPENLRQRLDRLRRRLK